MKSIIIHQTKHARREGDAIVRPLQLRQDIKAWLDCSTNGYVFWCEDRRVFVQDGEPIDGQVGYIDFVDDKDADRFVRKWIDGKMLVEDIKTRDDLVEAIVEKIEATMSGALHPLLRDLNLKCANEILKLIEESPAILRAS